MHFPLAVELETATALRKTVRKIIRTVDPEAPACRKISRFKFESAVAQHRGTTAGRQQTFCDDDRPTCIDFGLVILKIESAVVIGSLNGHCGIGIKFVTCLRDIEIKPVEQIFKFTGHGCGNAALLSCACKCVLLHTAQGGVIV